MNLLTKSWLLILCLGLAGPAVSAEPAPDRSQSASPLADEEMRIDMRSVLEEPLEATLAAVHSYWWSPLVAGPRPPAKYVQRVRALPRIQKLLMIAEQGDSQEKAELHRYINGWADRFVYEYPLANYEGNSDRLVGFSAVHPGMDAALTLVLAKLDPSWESLRRIVLAANRHAEARRAHSERKKLPAREEHHLPGTQSMYVFAYACLDLVEHALETDAAWLDPPARRTMESAVRQVRESEFEHHDYAAVLKAAQSLIATTEDF